MDEEGAGWKAEVEAAASLSSSVQRLVRAAGPAPFSETVAVAALSSSVQRLEAVEALRVAPLSSMRAT